MLSVVTLATGAPFFEDEIAPIFEANCVECHNTETRKANLDLSSAEGLIAGGDGGAIFEAGKPEKSLLYELIHNGEMPRKRDSLSETDIKRIHDWIEAGAQFKTQPQVAVQQLHQHDILPIMLLRCTRCHGPRLKEGDLDLRTKAGMLARGAILPGNPDQSPAIQRIVTEACPPKGTLLKFFVKRPTADEVEKLRAWIAAGAPEKDIAPDVATTEPDPLVSDEDRQHWAFQKPKHIDPPITHPNPIDAFVHAKHLEQGLSFSPAASRGTLIRRAHFDLIGLPPTLDELARWENHDSANWYAEMIDALLESPRYGERWGRYWLDVAGYSDSEGGQSADTLRQVAWKYRDYVIRAFNDDKPYDRFLKEQIAGDELARYDDPDTITSEIVDNLTATGFLRMGIDQTGSRTMNFVPERLGLISDAIDVVGSGVMGLSLKCARCHGHKYDPIPQRDYYRLKAVFQGAFDEHDWLSWKTRKLDLATPETRARVAAHNPPLEKEIKALESQRKGEINKLQSKYYNERWSALSKQLQDEILAALKVTQGRTTLRQDELLEKYRTYYRPDEATLRAMHPELATTLDNLDAKLTDLQHQLLPPLTIRALWDQGRPSPTYILARGEHHQPRRLVGPGVPSALTDGKTPFEVSPPWPDAEKTGRRLAFAKWLTQPNHPLTARVIVNRVWRHHFGRGLVSTLDNFGIQGETPTHPQLLDWLALDFAENGWSLKSLHRSIMLSQTYRQSSAKPEHDADPQNQWLARMPMQRQNAEALRDSILFVSGKLDETMFGAPSPVEIREDGWIAEVDDDGRFRRSVYLQFRRTETPSLMATFDYPQMEPNCISRSTSTVSPQALMLINSGRIHELAEAFAERVRQMDGDPVDVAYRLALSRSPSEEERNSVQKSLAELQTEWKATGTAEEVAARRALDVFCHMLLNSAEFLYID
ncbi:MAG: PSD1 and planctomycete cytochrome C domain-containing protein [Verrucomicrobiota bacterium]